MTEIAQNVKDYVILRPTIQEGMGSSKNTGNHVPFIASFPKNMKEKENEFPFGWNDKEYAPKNN